MGTLAASCSKSLPEKTVTVHFTVDRAFTAFMGEPAVRSIADGSAATEMYVGVFTPDGTPVEGLSKRVPKDATSGFDFDLALVEGLSYRVALFAQSAGRFVNPASWSAAGLKNIALTGFALNSESDDAFTAVVDVDASSGGSVAVNLSRPWAQVNVATTQSIGGLSTVGISVSGVPNVFNAFTGEASGSAGLSLSGTPLGGEFTTGYNYLGYAYVPVAGAGAGATVTISKDGTTAKTVENVPLRRNYRTNLLGDI